MRLLIDADIVARKAACVADSKAGGDQGLERACLIARDMMVQIFKDNDSTDHIGYLGTRGDRTQHRYKIYPLYKEHRKKIEKGRRKGNFAGKHWSVIPDQCNSDAQ